MFYFISNYYIFNCTVLTKLSFLSHTCFNDQYCSQEWYLTSSYFTKSSFMQSKLIHPILGCFSYDLIIQFICYTYIIILLTVMKLHLCHCTIYGSDFVKSLIKTVVSLLMSLHQCFPKVSSWVKVSQSLILLCWKAWEVWHQLMEQVYCCNNINIILHKNNHFKTLYIDSICL